MRRKTIMTKYFDKYEDCILYLNSNDFKEFINKYIDISINIRQWAGDLIHCYILDVLGNKREGEDK